MRLGFLMRDPEVLIKILSKAENDPSVDVRIQAIRLLSRNYLKDNEQVLRTLEAISNSNSPENVRTRAQRVLQTLMRK